LAGSYLDDVTPKAQVAGPLLAKYFCYWLVEFSFRNARK
jgi:hypothetical protein